MPAGYAAEGCGLKLVASIPASLSPDGELVLEATVNGIPVKLIAATNSDVSTLHEAFAKRAGMTLEDFHGKVFSSGQRLLNQKTEISSLMLGNAKTANGTFVISPSPGDGTEGKPVGALASDYLSSYDLEINLAEGKVNFFDHDHCQGQAVYWAKEYFATPMFLSDTGLRREPELNVIADGQSLRAVIATGYGMTTLRLATAQDRFGLVAGAPDMPQTGTWPDSDGRELPRYEHTFKSLTFGDITLHNTKIAVKPINMAARIPTIGSHLNKANTEQPDIRIGMSLLKQLRLYIAYDEHMLYYTVATPKQAANQ